MHKAVQIKARIVYNKRTKDNYFKSIFSALRIGLIALPGQFVNIKVNNCNELLLRRPFSIHRVNGARIEILYEVLGCGTKILSQRKVGEYLDIIGPLGNGFDCGSPVTSHQSPVLVAGGMGVAPLYFLAERLANRKSQIANRKIIVLIGAQTRSKILCEKEFKRLGCDVKIATDDGSRGFKGYVSDLVKSFLRATGNARLPDGQGQRATIYACGPRPMLKEIANISKKYNIPAEISLEEHMACGIGACLGCAVNTKNGYQRVCKEGPVFAADEIVWEDKDG